MKVLLAILFGPALASALLAGLGNVEPGRREPPAVYPSAAIQSQSTKTPRGSISGRVIANSGAGLMGATIGIKPAGNAGAEGYSARTDQEGKFRQNDLPAGAYTVTASAPGYIAERDKEPRFYHPGDTITINMVKGGVVSGTVTNASGEPLIRVPVAAVRVRDAARRPAARATGRQERRTDDRGLYRIYGLESGSYLVMAGGGANHDSNAKTPFDRDVPTYSPSSTRDTAAEIQVRAGEETAGVDIRYRAEPGHAVSGVITGAIGANSEGSEVTVYRANTDSVEGVATPWIEAPHGFAIYGLADGEYDLMATGDNPDGEAGASPVTHISIKGADATGINLALAPLARIAGRVVLENLPREARSDCKEESSTPLQEVLITARRHERKGAPPSHFSAAAYADPDESGNFSISELSAGAYHLEARLPTDDWFLRSITSESATGSPRATSDGPKKSVRAASDSLSLKAGDLVEGLIIKLARGASGLNGRIVSKEGSHLPPGLRAFLVPADPEYTGDLLRFAESDIGSDGKFKFANIAPGHYHVVVSLLTGELSREGNPYPVAWIATNRKELLGQTSAGEDRGGVIELKPCQRIANYTLSYGK